MYRRPCGPPVLPPPHLVCLNLTMASPSLWRSQRGRRMAPLLPRPPLEALPTPDGPLRSSACSCGRAHAAGVDGAVARPFSVFFQTFLYLCRAVVGWEQVFRHVCWRCPVAVSWECPEGNRVATFCSRTILPDAANRTIRVCVPPRSVLVPPGGLPAVHALTHNYGDAPEPPARTTTRPTFDAHWSCWRRVCLVCTIL